MDQSKKERILFSLAMTTGMVLIMSTYRMYLATRTLSVFPWMLTFARTWIIALLLSTFIARPIAQRAVNVTRISTHKPHLTGLATSIATTLCMTTCMSLIGMIFAHAQITFISYPTSWATSIIVSLPASLLIVGPTVRRIFKR
ncbi:hypothetical protein [Alloscardovia criceti]|uniref:hypothetical protein n=1 Tax=Alloscardovia criceti TaxID=356828 RepID=UPI0003722CC4|nr:hypothetical protein [Alloscardovia criceti]